MTTVARRDPADKAKIDAIEKCFDINPAFKLFLIRISSQVRVVACFSSLIHRPPLFGAIYRERHCS
ncbi:hypothetical protein HMPREF0305_11565 [Corynebacterium pseudogenitalium ATCC 33035]|uniref:Uncharacterized protein n=1 Tax=Corynebacterium pseudogenitalium ATCC 33035 TaxID=525264 RepID=E2S4W3_9CORY|nr:hypothetical protein HMPREF0305_11565 [Corynebacterium pseudogenitalium ATCC 33035]